MDSLVLPFGLVCCLGLAGVGLSLLALFQAKSAARVLERRTQARESVLEAALEAAKESMHGLATEVRDIQEHPPVSAVPAPPRSGLNLGKRSQALRMSRRGSSPSQIAAALDVPLQEVDLLLKVHRIVLSNLIVTTKEEAASARVG